MTPERKAKLKCILQEVAAPTIVAGVYVSFPSLQDNEWMKRTALAGAGFAAIMFVQEQLQRISKQERDRESFETTFRSFTELYEKIEVKFASLTDTLDQHFGSVRDAIQDLDLGLGQPIVPNEDRPARESNAQSESDNSTDQADTVRTLYQNDITGNCSDAIKFISEANRAMESGNRTAALLMGGLAFENALRRYATIMKIQPKPGMTQMLVQLKDKLGKMEYEEFRKVIQFRNRMAHAASGDLPSTFEAPLILQRYALAVHLLDKMANILS